MSHWESRKRRGPAFASSARLASVGGVLLTLLTGCGTTSVSPLIANKPGVVTGANKDGYAIVKSITFMRPPADVARILVCMQSDVDGVTGPPVQIDGAAKANGKAYATLQYSNYVAFALTVRGAEYRFDRLANAGLNGPSYELMASTWGTPENAYAALEGIADRVSGCASRTSSAL